MNKRLSELLEQRIEDMVELIAEDIAAGVGDKIIDYIGDQTEAIADAICNDVSKKVKDIVTSQQLDITLNETLVSKALSQSKRKHSDLKPNKFTRPYGEFITGEELYSTRRNYGLSQAKMAKKLGIKTAAQISGIETGRIFITKPMNETFKVKFPSEYNQFMDNLKEKE